MLSGCFSFADEEFAVGEELEAVAFVEGRGFEGIDGEWGGDGFDFPNVDALGGIADLIDAASEA